jgi:23S rRNA (pseudouridine1915-N3)-methyltransferase
MDLKIIAVGKIKDRAFLQKIEEYFEKIRHDAKLEIVEVKDSTPDEEGKKILDLLAREKNGAQVIALDEKGKLRTSREFAEYLNKQTRKVILIIGGPFGLSDQVKKTVKEQLALSPMTFTHEIARVLLLEQIYRAISIVKNRKYHKE